MAAKKSSASASYPKGTTFQSAVTGRIVTKHYAVRHPKTTVAHRPKGK